MGVNGLIWKQGNFLFVRYKIYILKLLYKQWMWHHAFTKCKLFCQSELHSIPGSMKSEFCWYCKTKSDDLWFLDLRVSFTFTKCLKVCRDLDVQTRLKVKRAASLCWILVRTCTYSCPCFSCFHHPCCLSSWASSRFAPRSASLCWHSIVSVVCSMCFHLSDH